MIINTIGDITGFAQTAKVLHDKMPKGEFWGVGDLIDRGPDSKGVLDFFIDNGYKSVMGNHEHMMLFEKIKNDPGVHPLLYRAGFMGDWDKNGGRATMNSFGIYNFEDFNPAKLAKYFNFIETMPLRHEVDGLILTHAPVNDAKAKDIFNRKVIDGDYFLLGRSVLWNRLPPVKIPGKFQVYGHNSSKSILWHTDKYPKGVYLGDSLEVPEGAWAVCIDTWGHGALSGLSIDTSLLEDPRKAIIVFQKEIEYV